MKESEKETAWKDCLGNLHENKELADSVNKLEWFKDWYDDDNGLWINSPGDIDAEDVIEWIIANKDMVMSIIG